MKYFLVFFSITIFAGYWLLVEDSNALMIIGDPAENMSKEMQCQDFLNLVTKHDGSSVCVKSESIPKLVQRNWLQDKSVSIHSTHNESTHSHTSELSLNHYDSHTDGLPVEDISPIALTIFEKCKRDDDCTIQKLQDITHTENKTAVLKAIDDLVSIYEDGSFSCHPNAHHVGEFLLGYVHGNFSETIPYIDSRCAAGVMHGLVENTISIQTLLYAKSISEVDIVSPCNQIDSSIGYDAKVECIHGMGHSLTKAYDYDVIKAEKSCAIYNDNTERYMCQGGLFMENINKYWDDKTGDFDAKDPYYPCNQITDRQAASLCYRYQALYFLENHNFEPQVAFTMCDKIGDKEFVEYCYKGASTHMASRYFEDIEETAYMCINVKKELQPACVKGAIESITKFVAVDLGDDFCYMMPDDLEEKCFERKSQLEESMF